MHETPPADYMKVLKNWTFRLDNAKTRCGNCSYRLKTITLSRHFVEKNTNEKVLNIIRHEIAHALTPGDCHGKKWKKLALKLGCNDLTCDQVEDFCPPNWYLKCQCGVVNEPRHRRSCVSNKVCKSCHGSLSFIRA